MYESYLWTLNELGTHTIGKLHKKFIKEPLLTNSSFTKVMPSTSHHYSPDQIRAALLINKIYERDVKNNPNLSKTKRKNVEFHIGNAYQVFKNDYLQKYSSKLKSGELPEFPNAHPDPRVREALKNRITPLSTIPKAKKEYPMVKLPDDFYGKMYLFGKE